MARTTMAVRIHAPGEAAALAHEEVALGAPGPGEVVVRHAACGVNFIDVYQRRGLYPLPLPAVMGNEAAGVVEELGAGVTKFTVGQRVAHCSAGHGCYAAHRVVPAARLVAVPDGLPLPDVAGSLLKGLTAEYLARRCWPVVAGMRVVVLAAAGGVGTLVCQWLERLGAEVMGVVGDDSKVGRAHAHGCAHVVVGYAGLADQVRATWPAGAGLVLDSVGADTWAGSLDSLAPRGCLVSYGNASGPVPAFAPLELAKRGSLYVTRPVLAHYTATAAELRDAAATFFAEVARGLRLPAVTAMPLAQARAAHDLLESRRLEGVLVLEPEPGTQG